jgi:hypothetical protein
MQWSRRKQCPVISRQRVNEILRTIRVAQSVPIASSYRNRFLKIEKVNDDSAGKPLAHCSVFAILGEALRAV